MRIIYTLLLTFISLLMTGCTVEGQLAEESKNVINVCKDTRDGEIFSYNSNTIKNVRVGVGAPTSMDIVTITGKKKTLTSDMVEFIKCEIK